MGATVGEVLLRLRCRGHPSVRATHGKTLEFALGGEITARATCVLGVAAAVEGAVDGESAAGAARQGAGALGPGPRRAGSHAADAEGQPGQPLAPLAGPIELRLTAGGSEAVVRALANPRWRPDMGIVVRRSGNRYPDTLATDADASAAGLPRDLTARLRDPSQELLVTVERAAPRSARGVLVLLALADEPAATARLVAEARAAEVIIAEDDAAEALLRAVGFHPDRIARAISPRAVSRGAQDRGAGGPGAGRRSRRDAVAGPQPGAERPGGFGQDLPPAAAALASGGRVLVVAAEALPGRSALPLLADPGQAAVEVAGLPPALAAAAASPSRAPVLLADGAAPREARALARSAPAAIRLVVRLRAAEVAAVCRAAPPARPVAAVTVVPEAPHQRERVLRIPPDQIGEVLPPRAFAVCCLDAAPVAAGTDSAEAPLAGPGAVQLAELVRALAGEGVSARTLAAAIGQLPGWSRNRAYEFARTATGEPGGTP